MSVVREHGRWSLWGLLLVPMVAAACGPEAGVRVTIDSDLEVGRELDELTLELAASQTYGEQVGHYTCQRATSSIDQGQLELPYVVVVRPGALAWRCLALRAIGRRASEVVVTSELFACPDLGSAVTNLDMWLDSACHRDSSPPDCGADELCADNGAGAVCEPSEVAHVFEAAPVVARSCDSSNWE